MTTPAPLRSSAPTAPPPLLPPSAGPVSPDGAPAGAIDGRFTKSADPAPALAAMGTLQDAQAQTFAGARSAAHRHEGVGAFVADGRHGLEAMIGTNASRLRSLANATDAELAGELVRHGASAGDVAELRERIDAIAEAYVRRGVIGEAHVAVQARIRHLEALSAEFPERLASLRAAAPGSEDAALARTLGIRGDVGDLARATEQLRASIAGLHEFRNRMNGMSWDPQEFPRAAGRVARRLGLESSWARLADEPTGEDVSHGVHNFLTMAEAAHLGVEILEGIHILRTAAAATAAAAAGTAAMASVGVGVIGVVVGAVVSHFSDAAHEEHLVMGRALGL